MRQPQNFASNDKRCERIVWQALEEAPLPTQELWRTNIIKSLINANVFLHAFIKMTKEVLCDAHAIG